MEGYKMIVTEAQRQQFETEGYFVLEGVIPEEHLAVLREASRKSINDINQQMDAEGVTVMGLNRKDSRYFIGFAYRKYPELRQFLFSDLMSEVCRATLGDTAYLFYEQYVIKAAEKGMKFSWHQDSGYVGYPHKPYLTCWCTLDAVTEANGTVYVLPYDRAGTRTMVPHVKDEETGDQVGYFGDDPGVPVIAPAGSIAVFASTVFHRSGFNTTDAMRRIYLAQYSSEPLLSEDGATTKNAAEPFLKAGENVSSR
ncbi:MAG: phytanoyl-CoA dioxygenase family protein [Cytophagales bacterium]|nr:phytanoyl-CoA dioxygenase family protein [Armatimonadota bacterium]